MRSWNALAAVVAMVGLFAAIACGDDKKTTTASPTAAASGSQSVTIQVDGDGDGFNAGMIAYFPSAITLHPGDTAKFKLADSGEPHTVSTGAPIKDLLTFVEGYCGPLLFKNEEKCGNNVQPPPDVEAQFNDLFGKIPTLLPDGPGDANQGPANPCFLETGDMAADAPCAKVTQPAFSGKQSFYSSGWLGADKDFVVKFADDIAPGTYRFLCLLHGPEMLETVTIVDKASKADSAADVTARLNTELKTVQAALAKPAADLKAFAGSDEGGTHRDVQVAAEADGVPALVAEFGPKQVKIKAGESVTWSDTGGGHTVSFNAGEDVKSLRVVSADGTIHVNQAALAPAQVTVPEPPAQDPNAPPSDEPKPLVDGGAWNGEGFLSTGGSGGPFKLTFTKAGTYTYKCLVHDGMEGTVTVE